MIGLLFFHDSDIHSKDEVGPTDQSHIMQGVFLHVLADSLSSLGVIISTILVKYFQVNIADPICSFLIAAMILISGIPFIKLTLCQLVLQSPPDLIKRVNALEN